MVYEEGVSDVFVNKKRDTEIIWNCPDFCYVILNKEKTKIMTQGKYNILLIFSDEEKARVFMEETDRSKVCYFLEGYSWDDIVDKFRKRHKQVLLDHKGVFDFYYKFPIERNI